MKKIKVATIVAAPSYRRGLGWLLRENIRLDVIKEAFDRTGILGLVYPPDIVLIDTGTAISSGIGDAIAVRNQYPHSKIILLTGFDELRYQEMALKSGLDALLKKPFNAKTLTATIDRLMGCENEKIVESEKAIN